MKISVYIAASLDGFIARENGDLDWLPGSDGGIDGEDFGFSTFIESVDMIVMGRKTFDMVISFGDWPYGERRVIVLSRKKVKIPEQLKDTVKSRSCSPIKLVDELMEIGVEHVYVDGGTTIQGFLEAGLIQEITITTVPILIGSGIPLFGFLDNDKQLRHIETCSFDNGFVQSKYEILK